MTAGKSDHRGRKPSSGLLAFLLAGLPVLVVCGLISGTVGGLLGVYLVFSADLPKIPDLRAYRPKTVSTFYAEDGTVTGVFYREKRFPVPVDTVPAHVVNAFLAAEDARFFSHPGVDLAGVARAILKNIQSGRFVQGGSTITQQVTRNILLTREKTVSRKIREAILAFRLERNFSKKEILGLYLNEVYLGNGAYGVESAARTYFGKSTGDVTLGEAALLGGLVSSPSKYSPTRNLQAAAERRAFVLGSMLRNGFISDEEYRLAKDEPIRLTENLPNPYETVPYFTETVRQYIVEKYGEERLYNDGLQVWTTCDPPLQQKASEALLEGARAWERRQNRPVGLLRRLKADELRSFLQAASGISHKPGDIIQAVVLQNHTPKKRDKKKETSPLQDCTLALQGDYRFRMELESSIPYRPNDLLEFRVTSVDGDKLVLEHESLPPIQGALVCIENRTGYVRALVGGLDFERSRFNRAVQAKRQPGSAFKPVVYAAALEWSHYGPYTVIVDEPIAVLIDPRDEPWIPLNSDGRFHGPMNLREALVHSRNTVSVKLMMDVGIDAAIEMAHNLGIQSPLGKHLSISLGASEVSPLELTTAYSVFPNMGTRVQPVLVKKVADRFGRILEDNESAPLEITRQSLTDQYARAWLKERATWAPAPYEAQVPPREAPPGSAEGTPGSGDGIGKSPWPGTEASSFSGLDAVLSSRGYTRPEPRRVLSPQTSYLMLSMLRETCVSGTAAAASRLRRRDLAGKTGTTDDCTDAWFIGFNPRYTTGVWMGYDAKVSLGRKEYGAAAALPVWMSFMKDIPLTKSSEGYPPPPGIVFSAWAGSQPPRNTGLDTLLESGPVLAQEFAAKQASPVDVPDGPGADPMHEAFGPYAWANPHAGMNPLAGVPGFGLPGYGPYSQPVYAGYSPDYYPGMIRILSPTGETLGHAPYSVNDRGKIVVYRDSMVPMPQVRQPPAEPDRSPSDRQALQQAPQQPEPLRSFLPRAAQILQHLQQFLPRGFYFEWGR